MSEINKHGLSRNIPADVKRSVRKRCGFGCVVCGCAVYQYEHLNPAFADAMLHDPEAIVLLCGGCHDRVTRRLLSKETVERAAADPRCLRQGFSFGPFDVGVEFPEVVIGTFRGTRTRVLIQAFGDSILTVEPPEEPGAPFRLSALLCDRDGREVLRIEDNEWKVPTTNWDVEVVGQLITIRRAMREVVLQIRTEAPRALIITRLDMFHRGTHIRCKEGQHLSVLSLSGHTFHAAEAVVSDADIGMSITPSGIEIGRGGSLFFGYLQTGGSLSDFQRFRAAGMEQQRNPATLHSWDQFRSEVFGRVVQDPQLLTSDVKSIYFEPYGTAARVDIGSNSSQPFSVPLPATMIPGPINQVVAVAEVIVCEIIRRKSNTSRHD